jgi:hypothetical protein
MLAQSHRRRERNDTSVSTSHRRSGEGEGITQEKERKGENHSFGITQEKGRRPQIRNHTGETENGSVFSCWAKQNEEQGASIMGGMSHAYFESLSDAAEETVFSEHG